MMICFEEDEILEMIDLIMDEEDRNGTHELLACVRKKLERALYDEEG